MNFEEKESAHHTFVSVISKIKCPFLSIKYLACFLRITIHGIKANKLNQKLSLQIYVR